HGLLVISGFGESAMVGFRRAASASVLPGGRAHGASIRWESGPWSSTSSAPGLRSVAGAACVEVDLLWIFFPLMRGDVVVARSRMDCEVKSMGVYGGTMGSIWCGGMIYMCIH
ncbi:hypothetical protein Dimus_022743, partial [Dionaea muscipula]